MAKLLKRPAVLMASHRRTWPKLFFQAKTEKELFEGLGYRAPLRRMGAGLALSPRSWPQHFFAKQATETYLRDFKAPSVRASKSPVTHVSFQTVSKSPLSLSALRDLTGAKINWHWFYGTARFYVSWEKLPVDQALSLVAGAIGAKLISKESNSFDFELSPAEVRYRIREMAVPRNKTRDDTYYDQADVNYFEAVFSQVSDAQIAALYERPGKTLEVILAKGTRAEDAAIARIRTKYIDSRTAPASIRDILEQDVDWSLPITAVLYADGPASVKLQMPGKKTAIVL